MNRNEHDKDSMFKIQNITKNDVVLADLRIVLGPNKIIDLDKVAPRNQTENSPIIKMGIQQKRLKIVDKDSDRIKPSENIIDKKALDEMEKRITAQIKAQLGIQATAQKEIPNVNPDIAQLNNTIQSLISKMSSQQNVVVQQNSSKTEDNDLTGDGISDDTMNRIHANTVKKMTKNVTGQIEHKKESVSDQKLKDNISALEDLM